MTLKQNGILLAGFHPQNRNAHLQITNFIAAEVLAASHVDIGQIWPLLDRSVATVNSETHLVKEISESNLKAVALAVGFLIEVAKID